MTRYSTHWLASLSLATAAFAGCTNDEDLGSCSHGNGGDAEWTQVFLEVPAAPTKFGVLEGLWAYSDDSTYPCNFRARFTGSVL